ncbi:MAG TPA: serine/threonine-protein kinase [Gemmatimonadales bacterium]|nr:serine/threonine-protein kinase [Gemmatimonadales bacterium]
MSQPPVVPTRFALLKAAFAPRLRLEREWGIGETGWIIYLAHDLSRDRQVCLKVFSSGLTQRIDPERFRTGVGRTARLEHPHILPILDCGETAGYLWLTLPVPEGETLRDRLEREQRLPMTDALRIAREVALALDYAHRQGVIHGELEPGMVWLTPEGRTLVAFPEGWRKRDAEPPRPTTRSDIYSVGVILYEMLTGTLEGDASGTLPLLSRIPSALRPVIARATAASPDDRYSSAAELAQALERAGRRSWLSRILRRE